MRRWLWAAALPVVLPALLAGLAPAAWVDRALQEASRGHLGLGNPHGTLWRGGGRLQAYLPDGRPAVLASLIWTVSGAELLRGRVRCSVLSEGDGRPVLDFTLRPGGLVLHDLHLDLPAQLLGAFSPTLREAGLAGRIAVRAHDLSIEGRQIGGRAELTWNDAASSQTPVRPLGRYRLELEGRGDGAAFRLSTLSGALTLAGEGEWRRGRRASFRGTAVPQGEQRREIEPLLRVLGRETGPGTYELRLDPNVGAI